MVASWSRLRTPEGPNIGSIKLDGSLIASFKTGVQDFSEMDPPSHQYAQSVLTKRQVTEVVDQIVDLNLSAIEGVSTSYLLNASYLQRISGEWNMEDFI